MPRQIDVSKYLLKNESPVKQILKNFLRLNSVLNTAGKLVLFNTNLLRSHQ
jgi:hypothetical protein